MEDQADNVPSPSRGPDRWDRIAHSSQFKDLLQLKKAFIVPALAFFFSYYFALSLLVGYAPKLASTRVVGTLTVSYLFALSQFVVGWMVAGLYLLAAARFDAVTKDLLARDAAQTQKNERQGGT